MVSSAGRAGIRIDLETIAPDELEGLTIPQINRVSKLFTARLVAIIRREALPKARRIIPRQTGLLRRSMRVRARGLVIEVYFARGAFYWHLQNELGGGEPLPRALDAIILEVVAAQPAGDILREIVAEVLSA